MEELKKFCNNQKTDFIEGEYEKDQWSTVIRGLELEPEGGRRCWACYQMRLGKTAQYAKNNNFDYFTTTLSISPHKKADKINQLGQGLEKQLGIKFYQADFKKKDGFKKANELSKQYNFYRQEYCGCIYSKRS